MKSKSYAVIFTYSFDSEVVVYLFDTWDEAWEFLEDSYNEELRIDKEENEWDSTGVIDKDEGLGYAKIFTPFFDRTDVTTMMIGNVYD